LQALIRVSFDELDEELIMKGLFPPSLKLEESASLVLRNPKGFLDPFDAVP
jgi:hypothetical protein